MIFEEIVDVARAVHYEMSYLSHVSKSDVVSESSFKYPAVEWLERKGGKDKVYFEKAHPVFYRRKTDISWFEDKKANYIELKFVKKETAGESEQQRYFDDLLRLCHIKMLNPHSNVYFIACGQTTNWKQCFQNLGIEAPAEAVPIVPYTEKAKTEVKTNGAYSKWFSFDGSDIGKDIDTKEFQKNYDTFTENYKFREESKHPDGLVLRTTLLWISEESMFSSCSTAVWKVDLIDVWK